MVVEYESNLIIPMLIFAFIVFVIPSYILIKKAVKEDEKEKNSFVSLALNVLGCYKNV